MIDEKKLIKDLQKWTQDDLYTPKQFELLIKAQPKVQQLKVVGKLKKLFYKLLSND